MTKDEWLEKYDSKELCEKYPNKIKEWWNPEKFDWEDSWALAKYCSNYFNIWWDAKKFNWEGSCILAQYCTNYFNIWWDADKYDWEDSWVLAKFCSKYFKIWWDSEKYNWRDGKDKLTKYCSSKFTDLQLKQLLLHPNKLAREFAIEELNRRENDKRRMVE